MNITAKSRYAIKIILDLAQFQTDGHQQRQQIALRHKIPIDYMDHIIARLKTSKIIDSIRGRSGGLKLTKDPKEISLWTIISSVEDVIYPVKCIDDLSNTSCKITDECISHDLWVKLFFDMKNLLETYKIDDFSSVYKNKKIVFSKMNDKSYECKAPSKK